MDKGRDGDGLGSDLEGPETLSDASMCDHGAVLDVKLDRLVDAFEAIGIPVRSNLRPGASEAELDAMQEELGVVLTEQFRALYR